MPDYYQVQGAMAIVVIEWCDFIVWTVNDMTVERIPFNRTFWDTCYINLQSIYLSSILPEIIYPRINLDLNILQFSAQIGHYAIYLFNRFMGGTKLIAIMPMGHCF